MSLCLFLAANVGLSGVNDFDYPVLSSISDGLANIQLMSTVKHVPLPSELVEQFSCIFFLLIVSPFFGRRGGEGKEG